MVVSVCQLVTMGSTVYGKMEGVSVYELVTLGRCDDVSVHEFARHNLWLCIIMFVSVSQ